MDKVIVQLSRSFKLRPVESEAFAAEKFSAHLDIVMDELLGLETDSLFDSDISAELTTGTMQITVSAKAVDFDQALSIADSAIRAAIHSAGGHTPNWQTPVFDAIAQSAELVPG